MSKILILGGTGFVGKALADSLKDKNDVIVTSGHHEVEQGYKCPVEEPDKLLNILDKEKPEIVISSLDGNFNAQLKFHEVLGNWIKEHSKKLIYISTLNVYDKYFLKAVDENTEAEAGSDYGRFKLDCEKMLKNIIGDSLVILRLSAVWAYDCPRIMQLKEYSTNGNEMNTYVGHHYTVTTTNQICEYVKYILENNLKGIFHVGSEDMVDSHEFELKVCDKLGITRPKFKTTAFEPPAYQGFLPTLREIPMKMRRTAADVLDEILQRVSKLHKN